MSIEAVRSRIAAIEGTITSLGGRVPVLAGADFSASVRAAGVQSAPDSPSGVNKAEFAADVLQRIGAPVTSENLKLFDAWISSEGTKATFNPLATVRDAPGATNMNKVGVKNFVSYEQGVDTTVGAITNGLYDDVIAALRRGDDAYAVADAIARSPWGTGGLVRSVLESRDAKARDAG